MSTKANMVARGIITQEAQMCVTGAEKWKSCIIYFSLVSYWELWHLVRNWIEVYGADPYSIDDNFLQFTYWSGVHQKIIYVTHLAGLCLSLMEEHNNMLFSNKETHSYNLLEKVKIHSHRWMKATNVVYVLGVHNWLACLLDCLGIE